VPGGNIVDTCTGDSGGPFMVTHPTNPNTFYQIGKTNISLYL